MHRCAWVVIVVVLCLVWVSSAKDNVRLISFFPPNTGPDRAIAALADAFDSTEFDVTRLVYSMPPSLDDYLPWIQVFGASPDILPWYPLGGGYSVFTDEFFHDVSDIYAATGLDDDLPAGVRQSYTGPDGGLYGVPLIAEVYMCAHRVSVVDALGLSAPKTWSELFAFCDAVLAAGLPHCLAVDFASFSPTPMLDYLMIRMHGNAFYQNFFDGLISFEDPRILTSLQQFCRLFFNGYLATKPDGTLPQALDLATNTSAIFCGVDAASGGVISAGVPETDLRAFAFPEYDGEGGTARPDEPTNLVLGALTSLGIPKKAPYPEHARSFLAYTALNSTTVNVTLPALRSGMAMRSSLAPLITNQRSSLGFRLIQEANTSIPQATRAGFVHSPISVAWSDLLRSMHLAEDPPTQLVQEALPVLESKRLQFMFKKTSDPSASVPSGTYSDPVVVELFCLTPDAVIHFTTDGSTPTAKSLIYEAPLVFGYGTSTELQAMAVAPGLHASELVVLTFVVPQVAQPQSPITPAANDEAASQTLVLVLAITFPVAALVVACVAGLGYVLHRRSAARNMLKIGSSDKDIVIDPPELMLGDTVGQGAYGTVYSGRWRSQHVAIKRMTSAELTRKELKQFTEEAGMLLRLRHSNIVLFHGVMLDPPSIVTEFMERGSLYDVIHDRSLYLHPSIVTTWAYQIARGLQFLKLSGVVHGDMKSLNVLLDGDWRAKIADFGMSILVDKKRWVVDPAADDRDGGAEASTGGTRQSGNGGNGGNSGSVSRMPEPPLSLDDDDDGDDVLGTLYWTAPEILQRGMRAVSSASDAYALGITLWEMVTREQLYPDENPLSVAVSVMSGLRPSTDLFPSSMSHLKTMCQQLWVEDPSERISFDTAVEILEPLTLSMPPVLPSHATAGYGFQYMVHIELLDAELDLLNAPDQTEELLLRFHAFCDDFCAQADVSPVHSQLACEVFAFTHVTQLEAVIHCTTKCKYASTLGTRLRFIVVHDEVEVDVSHYGKPTAVTGTAMDHIHAIQKLLGSRHGPTFGLYAHESVFGALDKVFLASDKSRMAIDSRVAMSKSGRSSTSAVDEGVRMVRVNRHDEPAFSLTSSSAFIHRWTDDTNPDAHPTEQSRLSVLEAVWVNSMIQVGNKAEGGAPSQWMGCYGRSYLIMDKNVVLKVLSQQSMAVDRLVKFVCQIVRISKAAEAYNALVAPTSVCPVPPFVSLTVPYFATGSLHDLLQMGGYDTDIAKGVLIGLARALAQLHDVWPGPHGALRPSNVMLGASMSDVYLVDWGMEEMQVTLGAMTRTKTPMMVYSSPEVLRGESATYASDVFAFASIAYRLLTHELPFKGPGVEACHSIIGNQLPVLTMLSSDVQTFLTNCWSSTPSRRPRAVDLVLFLESCSDASFATNMTPMPPVSTPRLFGSHKTIKGFKL